MKERPIIFNADMVRAVLDGRKTQTRRIMKNQPVPHETREGDFYFRCNKTRSMIYVSDFTPGNGPLPDAHEYFSMCCPFGAVGDRLWVREAFRVMGRATDVARLMYKASERNSFTESTRTVPIDQCNKQSSYNWTPSIHMPRWASRITLEITGVRVERLNSISEADAKAEGLKASKPWSGLDGCIGSGGTPAAERFESLWQSIYGEESWQANPWVWVIEFKRVEATHD
jgi:hypothetical protein